MKLQMSSRTSISRSGVHQPIFTSDRIRTSRAAVASKLAAASASKAP